MCDNNVISLRITSKYSAEIIYLSNIFNAKDWDVLLITIILVWDYV